MVRQRPASPHGPRSRQDGESPVPYEPTLLRLLVTERHWQKYPTFERQFKRAAEELAEQQGEPELGKVTVSPRQFERWYAGTVKTEPYPDACRVLEYMFGKPVGELFARMPEPRVGEPAEPVVAEREPGGAEADWEAGIVSVTENARLMMAGVLTAARRPDIDYLTEGAYQHAIDSIRTPPEQMLRRLISDHNQVRVFLSRRLSLSHQVELYRIAALLSSLIADELMVLGKPLYADSWHYIARRAADETRDDALRAHVRTLAAMLPLYYGDPAVTIRLTREAQGILAGRRHAATALAPTLEALACAQAGDGDSGRIALENARRSFDGLDAAERAESVFGFSERRWRFYESRILSELADIPTALEAQRRAMALYPPEVVGDRALLQLDIAKCVVRDDISAGVRVAGEVLLGMPPEHRADIFLRYGWGVISAVPVRFRNRPDVTEYRDLLRHLSAAIDQESLPVREVAF